MVERLECSAEVLWRTLYGHAQIPSNGELAKTTELKNSRDGRSRAMQKRGIQDLKPEDKEAYRLVVENANELDMRLYARAAKELDRRVSIFGVGDACSLGYEN